MCRTHKIRDRHRAVGVRHAAHHADLKPQHTSKKVFKKIARRISREFSNVKSQIRGFEVRRHSPNYGALDQLFKKAVSVSVQDDGNLLVINIPQY